MSGRPLKLLIEFLGEVEPKFVVELRGDEIDECEFSMAATDSEDNLLR
jgi:hypothetical protein